MYMYMVDYAGYMCTSRRRYVSVNILNPFPLAQGKMHVFWYPFRVSGPPDIFKQFFTYFHRPNEFETGTTTSHHVFLTFNSLTSLLP
jgi:hypothetical protein